MGEHRRNPKAIAKARGELATKPKKPLALYPAGERAPRPVGPFRRVHRMPLRPAAHAAVWGTNRRGERVQERRAAKHVEMPASGREHRHADVRGRGEAAMRAQRTADQQRKRAEKARGTSSRGWRNRSSASKARRDERLAAKKRRAA